MLPKDAFPLGKRMAPSLTRPNASDVTCGHLVCLAKKYAVVLAGMAVSHAPADVSETGRRRHVSRVRGLPEWAVGTGHREIQQAEFPVGLARTDPKHTDD